LRANPNATSEDETTAPIVATYIISKGEGGPMDGTMLYSLYLFRQAFMFNNMGYASAMAWVMLLLVGIMTGILFKTSKSWVFYESEGGK